MIEQKHGEMMTKRGNVIDLAERRRPFESERRNRGSADKGEQGAGKVVDFYEHSIFGNDLKKCVCEYNKDGSSFFVYRMVPRHDIIDAKQRLEQEIEKAKLSGIVDDLKINVESRVRSGMAYIEVMAMGIEAREDAYDRFCRALKKLVERIAPEL